MASDRATRGRRPEGDASAKAAAKPRGRRPGASTAREDILDASGAVVARTRKQVYIRRKVTSSV